MTEEEMKQYGLRDINTSKVYYTGRILPTKNSGDVIILGQINKKGKNNGYEYYWIKFLAEYTHGYTMGVQASNLKRGNVKSPYDKRFRDHGYLGEGDALFSVKGVHTKEALLWMGMLMRVYSEEFHKKRPSYIGSTISDRWLCYNYFYEDLPKLKGYKQWKENEKLRAWHLDKDISEGHCNHYSLETCSFVPARDNTLEAMRRKYTTGKTYIAHRLSDDYEEEFTYIVDFEQKYNIGHNVGACLKGQQKTSKGWTFRIKEEKEIE